MLAILGVGVLLAGQPAAALPGGQAAPPVVRSPYLDAVRAYGTAAGADAVRVVAALRVDRPTRLADEIDLRVCRALGARSCRSTDVEGLEPGRRAALFALWRSLYPRALAVHIEILGRLHPARDADALAGHRAVVLQLIARIDEIAAHRDVADDFARFATAGRRLLVWAHQYLLDEAGLAKTLEALSPAIQPDEELQLAVAALAELRAAPDTVAAALRAETAAAGRAASLFGSLNAVEAGESPPSRRLETNPLVDETRHRLEVAAAAYQRAIAAGAGGAEAHLRVGRILIDLDRLDAAATHLSGALALAPDPRQTYLIALFLADLRERQLRTADAMAAYARALAAWPGAQAAVVGLARLRAMSGAVDAARATLSRIHAERDAQERSDPWMGYVGGQGWRVPAALDALRRDFEPLP